MPTYHYLCKECHREWSEIVPIAERNHVECCGQTATKLIKGVRIKPDIDGLRGKQGGVWMDNLGPEPIHIESRTQLREECKRRQLSSKYLDG